MFTFTAFTLTQFSQFYLNQVKFQPIKCTQFVRLSIQMAPFDNLVLLELVLLPSVNREFTYKNFMMFEILLLPKNNSNAILQYLIE